MTRKAKTTYMSYELNNIEGELLQLYFKESSTDIFLTFLDDLDNLWHFEPLFFLH